MHILGVRNKQIVIRHSTQQRSKNIVTFVYFCSLLLALACVAFSCLLLLALVCPGLLSLAPAYSRLPLLTLPYCCLRLFALGCFLACSCLLLPILACSCLLLLVLALLLLCSSLLLPCLVCLVLSVLGKKQISFPVLVLSRFIGIRLCRRPLEPDAWMLECLDACLFACLVAYLGRV